jgi:hypothetical protein
MIHFRKRFAGGTRCGPTLGCSKRSPGTWKALRVSIRFSSSLSGLPFIAGLII